MISIISNVDSLLPHITKEKIIDFDQEKDILSKTKASDKVQELLSHISGHLRGGYIHSFHLLLDIMESYGTLTTKELATDMKNSIKF